ncbi:MAG: dihydrofolate reductase family protein [Gammaproteobacteria bacterium]|nr:dihydrofolate reductase family protein [Gammaproteobacteria bacterium]
MRQVCYSVAMSLDGYIAGPNGEFDWIVMDPEVDFSGHAARFDTHLVGRKSFEAMQRMGGAPPAQSGVREIVFSRTLDPAHHPKIALEADAVRVVRELRERPGKDIWLFGGGELFRSLLAAGLVDRVEVGIIPVLLGGGIPLLPSPAERAVLKLISHEVYEKTGTLGLEYEVVRVPEPAR